MSGTAEPEPEAAAPPQQTPRSHHQTTKAANTSENFEEDPSFATRTIALFFLHLPVVFMFGMCFTEMGYGATVQKGLSKGYNVYKYLVGAAAALLFVAYTFDIFQWHGGCWLVMKRLIYLLVVLACAIGALISFASYPYLPLALVLAILPLWYMMLRRVFFQEAHIAQYVRSVGLVNIIAGVACFVTSVGWAAHHNYWWGEDSKYRFKSALLVNSTPEHSACLPDCSREVGLRAPSCDLPSCNATWNSEGCLSFGEGQHWDDFDKAWSPSGKMGDGWAPQDRFNPACQSVECQWEMASDPDAHCLPAFLLYSSQFIAALGSLAFGIISVMFARSVRAAEAAKVKDADQMNPVLKIFFIILGVLVVAMWAAASIAGASMKLANMVFALAFVALVIMSAIVGATVGRQALEEEIAKIPMVNSIENSRKSKWMKAIFLLFGGWAVLPLYFFVSFFTQCNRKHCRCTKNLQNTEGTDYDERALAVTEESYKQYLHLKKWSWTQILQAMVTVGVVYFVMAVGAARYTNMFLSWLNSYLVDLGIGLGAVTMIYIGVGLGMFLLPPVPGVPVYLTGGIILSGMCESAIRPELCTDGSSAEAVASGDCTTLGPDGMSTDPTYFWLGILYGSVFAFITKMLAVVMQQKGIGGVLGKRVGVRAAIDVNSQVMRAIKLILQAPGCITKGKVLVLCGGPDWPTSVTTGVLGLPLVPMLLGTLPIAIPITLTVAAGGMMLKTEPQWVAVQGLTLGLTAMGQSIMLIGFMVEVEKVTKTRLAEIEAMPTDQPVKDLEVQKEKMAAAKLKATEWGKVPCFWKFILLLAAGCMVIATSLFAFFGSRCFESVQVTTDLEALGDRLDAAAGKVLPTSVAIIMRPLGALAMACELASWVFAYIFGCWAGSKAKQQLALDEAAADKERLVTSEEGGALSSSKEKDGVDPQVGKP